MFGVNNEMIKISVITLSWDNRDYTEKFVESIRENTSLSYELIIVDNGSLPEIQKWVETIADKTVIFKENQGFSKGFNAGINVSEGKYLMMANNDTEFPPGWDLKLVETMENNLSAGIVSPVYTSGRRIALRSEPGMKIKKVGRFRRGPSGVAYFVRKDEMVNIFKNWGEEYIVASGEDADLCFKVWVNNFDVLIDERVLIIHEGKATASKKLLNWKELYSTNAKQFRKKWFYYFYFPYLARITQRINKTFFNRI